MTSPEPAGLLCATVHFEGATCLVSGYALEFYPAIPYRCSHDRIFYKDSSSNYDPRWGVDFPKP